MSDIFDKRIPPKSTSFDILPQIYLIGCSEPLMNIVHRLRVIIRKDWPSRQQPAVGPAGACAPWGIAVSCCVTLRLRLPLAPNLRHLEPEAFQRASAFNALRVLEHHGGGSGFVNGDSPAEWVDAPAQANTIGDPLLHLGVQLRQRVGGGENLDEKVGREGQKSLLFALALRRETARLDPGRIGRKRGPVGKIEACIGTDRFAATVCVRPREKLMHNVRFSTIIPETARSHH